MYRQENQWWKSSHNIACFIDKHSEKAFLYRRGVLSKCIFQVRTGFKAAMPSFGRRSRSPLTRSYDQHDRRGGGDHDRRGSPPSRSGHQLNYILFTFHNQGSVVKSAFSTNAQSRFASAVLDGVLGPPRLVWHT